jgi:hypothetical protein
MISDDQYRPVFGKGNGRFLDFGFIHRIYIAGKLIQYHNRRVFDKPRYMEIRRFYPPPRQVHAIFPDGGVITFRQAGDKIVNLARLVASITSSLRSDIDILHDDTDVIQQIIIVHAANIHTTDFDAPGLCISKTQQKICNGGFA